MNDDITILIAVVLTAIILAFTAWWNVGFWLECRATNSFFYCLYVLAK